MADRRWQAEQLEKERPFPLQQCRNNTSMRYASGPFSCTRTNDNQCLAIADFLADQTGSSSSSLNYEQEVSELFRFCKVVSGHGNKRSYLLRAKPRPARALAIGTVFVNTISVFHRILDFKYGLDFYPGLFFYHLLPKCLRSYTLP
jgi:hypothetical protein